MNNIKESVEDCNESYSIQFIGAGGRTMTICCGSFLIMNNIALNLFRKKNIICVYLEEYYGILDFRRNRK